MVNYANITHRVTFIGDMFTGQEEWNTGFYIGNESGGDMGAAPTLAEAQACATAFQTFFTTAANAFNGNYRFLAAKISSVNTLGMVDGATTQFYNLPTPAQGAGSGVSFPPQISVVATLATVRTRGHGSKGRMYLPGISAGPDSTGHIASATVTSLTNTLKTCLDSINAHADVPGEIVLNSAQVTTPVARDAIMLPITNIRIGNVYDTQRRRRNALAESYTTAVLA